jgi:hypothetical protein
MSQAPVNSWKLENGLGIVIEPDEDKTVIRVTYEYSVLPLGTMNKLTPKDRDVLLKVLSEEGLDYFPVDDRPYDRDARLKLVRRLKDAGVNL